MNDTNSVITSIKELHRRTDITCKARYHAARRMSLHGGFSQWTLALLAVGQIVIALIAALKLHSNFSENYLNFGTIFFGVLVLTYSLLLGMADFSSRSVKLHGCGLELGRISRKLFLLSQSDNPSQTDYDRCSRRYYNILDKYENHSRIDYLTAHHQYYDAEASKLNFGSCERRVEKMRLFLVLLRIYFFHTLQFFHYLFSIGLISFWIYFLVRTAA